MKSIFENKKMCSLMLGSSIISFSAIFVRLTSVSSSGSAFYRVLFGGIFLLFYSIIKKEKLWTGMQAFLYSSLAGIFFSLDLMTWHKSIKYIGPGLATVLANFQVIFIAIISFFILKEKINFKFFVSILLALLGIFLLCGTNWNVNAPGYRVGVVLGLTTAIFYTGYILTLKFSYNVKKPLSTAVNIFWVCVSAVMFLGLISLFSGESYIVTDSKDWIFLLAYGIFCQGFGWVLISSSLSEINASKAGLILLLQPALAMVWDVLFFKRPTSISDIIGFIIALGAIYIGTLSKENENKKNNKIKTEKV